MHVLKVEPSILGVGIGNFDPFVLSLSLFLELASWTGRYRATCTKRVIDTNGSRGNMQDNLHDF